MNIYHEVYIFIIIIAINGIQNKYLQTNLT